jgi:hypothetical protein
MWIRIGVNAYPDPAFYLVADPDHSNQCRFMRIRFMVTLCRQKKLNLYRYIKNILFVGKRLLNIPAKEQTSFLKVEIQAYLLIWSNPLLLDPDPHSQYGSGSRYRRVRIHNTDKQTINTRNYCV